MNKQYICIVSICVFAENKLQHLNAEPNTLISVESEEDCWLKVKNHEKIFYLGKWHKSSIREASAEEAEQYSDIVIENKSKDMVEAFNKFSKDFSNFTKELKKEMGKIMAEGKRK